MASLFIFKNCEEPQNMSTNNGDIAEIAKRSVSDDVMLEFHKKQFDFHKTFDCFNQDISEPGRCNHVV